MTVRGVMVRGVLAQARLETRLLLRSSESLLVTLGVPLGILAFFATVPVLPTGGVDPITFLVPGVLALASAATGLVASAIQTAYERKAGSLRVLAASPLGRGGFVAAKLASVVALLIVQAALVLGLGLALGWRPAAGPAGIALALAGVLVAGLALSGIGLALVARLSAEATTAVTNAVFLALLLVGGVAVAPEALPPTLAGLGAASPVGAAAGVLRAALDGADGGGAALAALLAWGVAGGAVAVRGFRWED